MDLNDAFPLDPTQGAAEASSGSSGGGGGCTINPRAEFDPTLLVMLGASIIYLRRHNRRESKWNEAA